MKGNLYRTAILIMLSVFIFSCIFVSPAAAADPFTMENDTHKRGFDTSADKRTLNGNESVQLFSKKDINFNNSAEFTANIPKSMKEYVILLDSSGSLKPEIHEDNPFDFALFSGNEDPNTTLNLQASNIRIDGKTHSNSNINVKSSNVTTNSEFQYTNDYYQTGGINDDKFVKHPAINMPDLSEKLKDPKYGTLITVNDRNYKSLSENPNSDFKKYNNGTSIDYRYENVEIKSSKITLDASGSITEVQPFSTVENMQAFLLNGDPFVINDKQTYFFEGNVIISNSLDIRGTGMIIAKGDIIIKGGELKIKGNSSGLIYSAGGRIVIQPNDIDMNGILYAPQGSIIMQGTNNKVNGNVVAKDIVSIPGTTNIKYDDSSGTSENVKDAIGSESYFSTALQTAVKLIGDIDIPCKLGVIKYDRSANGNPDYALKEINNELDLANFITDKKEKIKSADNGQSNLGDGIRRAYYMLKNSGSSTAQKSIIIFPGIKPNVSTIATNSGDSSFIGEGDAPSSLIRSDVSLKTIRASMNADTYAKEMAYLAASDGITPYFINYVPDADSFTDVETVINGSNGIVQYIKGKVTALVNSNLYHTASNVTTLSNVIKNEITPVNSYNVKIAFSFKLPKSVEASKVVYTGSPMKDWLRITKGTDADGKPSYSVDGEYDTKIYADPTDPKIYRFSATDTIWSEFYITVKFNNSKRVKNGYSEDYIFTEDDNKITYTIAYNDGVGDKTYSFTPIKYPKLDVTSLYKIEIQ